jgi:predicted outer membrane repeat protein
VAKGVYYPDEGVGQSDGDRNSTFFITENVKLYGGFDTNDNRFSERDWEGNVTVLSGDMNGDDLTDSNGVTFVFEGIIGINAYHVVFLDGASGKLITEETVLDGFTICGGHAYGAVGLTPYGGGLYCQGSGTGSECSPRLNNLNFSGNVAKDYGGAMFNDGSINGKSNPTLLNVSFTNNYAGDGGGAVFNDGHSNGDSSPGMTSIYFSQNEAGSGGAMYNNGNNGKSSPSLDNVEFNVDHVSQDGGAIYNDGSAGISSPNLKNVDFRRNWAANGGAIYNHGVGGESSPALVNVSFTNCSASLNGGAMYNFGNNGKSLPILDNVSFSGNSAGSFGGAVYNDGSNGGVCKTMLTNVTFSGNKATISGGAVFSNGLDGNSSLELRNSILWNNQDSSGTGNLNASIFHASAFTLVKHSLLQGAGASGGGWTSDTSFDDGGGNIDKNPKFITPVDPSSAPTAAGDLHLKSSSPAIDAGKNAFINYPFDLDNLWRIRDGDRDGELVVDMGAYEYPHDVSHEIYSPLVFR